MAKFLITRTCKYTTTLEVDAPDEETAREMSAFLEDEFVHNNNDWVYSEYLEELK